jgi:N-acetylmuramoyl-L-alanine amidase
MIFILPAGLTFGPLSPRRSTRRIIIHHSASPDVSAATIHTWHLQQGWSGIGYHFVIRQNGDIEAGRPVDMLGAHSGPEVNNDSIGICLTGNFMENSPTYEQMQSLVQLVSYLRELYESSLEVMRHKDVLATECPGVLFPWPESSWPLKNPPSNNQGGNSMEPWKKDIMTQAMDKKLITQPHDPDEPVPKWFVLVVALNLLQEIPNLVKKQPHEP